MSIDHTTTDRDAGEKAGPGGLFVLGLAASAPAVAVLVWALVGPQRASTAGLIDGFNVTDDYYNYLLRAPEIDPLVAGPILAVAVTVLVAVTASIAVLARQGRLRRAWWAVLAALWAAGAITGGGARIVTAGVIGANIGGVLVVVVGAPAVVGLLVATGIGARSLLASGT